MRRKNSMFRLVVLLMGGGICLFLHVVGLALDKSRLWLPNKYTELMPELVKAALDAEKTRRCKWVINGKMDVSGATDNDYYFVITCRDEEGTSYNLTYHYSKVVNKTSRIAKQGLNRRKQKGGVNEDNGIDEQTIRNICNDAFSVKTENMDQVIAMHDKASKVKKDQQGYYYQLPFSAGSALGNDVLYRAECSVGNGGIANINVFLESLGALAICKDTLRIEAIQLKGLSVIDDEVKDVVENDDGFFYQIPFKAIIPGGNIGKFQAKCDVDMDGTGDVSFTIDPSAVIPLCIKKLKKQTRTMMNVVILENANTAITESDEEYQSNILFNTQSPMGKTLHYQAHCVIDNVGITSVSISPKTKPRTLKN